MENNNNLFPGIRDFTVDESIEYNKVLDNLYKKISKKDLDSDIVELVNDNFWELINE
jgi:hypothetical protein